VAVLQAQADKLELRLRVWTPDREHAKVVAQLAVDHVVVEHVAEVEQHRFAVPADAVKDVRRVTGDDICPGGVEPAAAICCQRAGPVVMLEPQCGKAIRKSQRSRAAAIRSSSQEGGPSHMTASATPQHPGAAAYSAGWSVTAISPTRTPSTGTTATERAA
jgi:hypothetical protein